MPEKEIVSIPGAPKPIAPFSPAVKAAGLVFVSGQLPLNASGKIPDGISEQTRQCMENIEALVKAAGSGMDRVLKCTVYLKDFDDFGKMNEVYAGYFKDAPPARAAVEVSRLARGALVEIEAIALA
jgi:2-iminobutanoate/2-iminopropanoate deaminase